MYSNTSDSLLVVWPLGISFNIYFPPGSQYTSLEYEIIGFDIEMKHFFFIL